MSSIPYSATLPWRDARGSDRRWLFSAFLIFSVCFYSYRFLFGMGSPLTTYYNSDAPGWLRASKDVVWLSVLVLALFSSDSESHELVRQIRETHVLFFQALSALVVLFFFTGLIHLFYYQSALDTFLFWIRYPLEYIPLVFFMPLFVLHWRPLVPVFLGLGWLSLAFLLYEMFSGKQMGFSFRYGSIFGSPNDFGVFCVLVIIGLIVCARHWSHWLLLVLMSCALVCSLSRSAFAGFVAGACSLLYLRRGRFYLLAILLVVIPLVWFLYVQFPDLFGYDQVRYGVMHFDVDNSTLSRLKELHLFQVRFEEFDLGPLFFGTDYFHIESWYLALMVRTGITGLLLWIGIIGATILRGWRFRHLSPPHAVAASSLIAISVASAFVPYPDSFPTNLYLWIAVGAVWLPPTSQRDAPLVSQP